LFARSQTETWKPYDIHDVVVLVRPIGILAMVAFGVLWRIDGGFWKHHARISSLAVFLASSAAIARCSSLPRRFACARSEQFGRDRDKLTQWSAFTRRLRLANPANRQRLAGGSPGVGGVTEPAFQARPL
jgi:hypothetical protein